MPQRRHRAIDDVAISIDPDEELSLKGGQAGISFVHQFCRYTASCDSQGLKLTPCKHPAATLWRRPVMRASFGDLLAITVMEKVPLHMRLWLWSRRKKGGIAIVVHLAEKYQQQPWRYRRHVLLAEDAAVARGWAADVNSWIQTSSSGRPSRLLVIANPTSGSRQASKIWNLTVHPILSLTGIVCTFIETRCQGHGQQVIEDLSLEELRNFDGILAVGGDGMFQEVINGLLAIRTKGGAKAVAAEGLKIAQIPAGSTDAVAWTLHASRSPETAALHAALGDFGSLDVMRVDSGDGNSQHSVCYAAYGYMGDIMRRSGKLRWLGSLRHVVSGAIAFILGRSYAAQISFIPASSQGDIQQACRVGCSVCASGVVHADAESVFAYPAARALQTPTIRSVEGKYRSIMLIVTPCRSDMSRHGLAPYAHLSDGRIQIILVKQCSQLNYLKFLSSIPRSGILPQKFDFVELIEATAVRVIPKGTQSCWNVDGEIPKHNAVEAQIHRGLVRIFSSGPP